MNSVQIYMGGVEITEECEDDFGSPLPEPPRTEVQWACAICGQPSGIRAEGIVPAWVLCDKCVEHFPYGLVGEFRLEEVQVAC